MNNLMKPTFLSIVIPAFNEENRIEDTISRIQQYLDKQAYSSEIIVVDDGSYDNTTILVEKLALEMQNLILVKNGENKGKGYSVRNGFLHSSGQFLLFSDADLATPIEEIEKLLFHLNNGYEVAIGSRALKESDIQIHQPWHRETMGKVFNLLVRALIVGNFKDTQCGFKCFLRNAALEICKRQKMERFSFDVEMIYIAQKLGYKVREVPIQWFDCPHSKVNALKDSYKMFMDLMKIRINVLKGFYSLNLQD